MPGAKVHRNWGKNIETRKIELAQKCDCNGKKNWGRYNRNRKWKWPFSATGGLASFVGEKRTTLLLTLYYFHHHITSFFVTFTLLFDPTILFILQVVACMWLVGGCVFFYFCDWFALLRRRHTNKHKTSLSLSVCVCGHIFYFINVNHSASLGKCTTTHNTTYFCLLINRNSIDQ